MSFLIYYVQLAFISMFCVAQDRMNKNSVIIYFCCIFIFAILPAFQYGVTTDYFNYIKLYNNPYYMDYYFHRGEYFFYYLMLFLYNNNISYNFFFIIVSIIQAILFFNIIRLLNKKSMLLCFLLICMVTSFMQNQMNEIRGYVAIYAFINALIYVYNEKKFKAVLFLFFGSIWHVSILPLSLLFFIPYSFHLWVVKHPVSVFCMTFFLCISGIVKFITENIVANYFPIFQVYVDNLQSDGSSYILGKVVYYPVFFLFIYLFNKGLIKLNSKTEEIFTSCFLLFSNLLFVVLTFPIFYRYFSFFAIFTVMPFYLIVNNMDKRFLGIKVLVFSYSFFVYFYKMYNIYTYNTYVL